MMKIRILITALMMGVASCSAPLPSPPATRPAPAPVAVAAPPPQVSAKLVGDWIDWPIAPGDWVYRTDERGSLGLFGVIGRDAIVTLRCDKARGRIYLARSGKLPANGGQITIRSSSMMKRFTAADTGGTPYIATEIMPNDPMLDAMVYSRGRIAIEVTGQQPVAIPIWAEFGRIVEDCR